MRSFSGFLTVSSLAVAGAVLFYMYRATGDRAAARRPALLDIVEESSVESFPASDAPPWTQGALM